MRSVPFVRVTRGSVVESMHCGMAAVATADGRVIAGWGDADTVTYPRSSLKPFQATAIAESGALEAFGLEERHLAMATASHKGEAMHTEIVAGWLKRLGLPEEALACGPDLPGDRETAERLLAAGGKRSRINHNCSGKHCGFLTLARHLGAPTAGYNDIGHPAQRAFLDSFSGFLGFDARTLAHGRDGCTLPALALKVSDMARALARLAAARVDGEARRSAVLRLHAAMRAHPELVSGSADNLPRLVAATRGRVLAKGGAEGYMAAFVPDQGIGIAIKIADGQQRATWPALIAILARLRLLDPGEVETLAAVARPLVRDSSGTAAGLIEACLE